MFKNSDTRLSDRNFLNEKKEKDTTKITCYENEIKINYTHVKPTKKSEVY